MPHRNRFYGLCTLLVFLLLATRAGADVSQSDLAALSGISKVAVVVEQIQKDSQAAGFDPERYAADVELKLRLAGISVVEPEEARLGSLPVLYVSVQPVRYSEHAFAVSTTFELMDGARLVRDPETQVFASTWREGIVGVLGRERIESERSVVRDLADRFIDAYLAANPKTEP